VLKSLCHEKRHRTETAKQFFRSSHFNSRLLAQHGDTAGLPSAADRACNGDNPGQQPQQQQQ